MDRAFEKAIRKYKKRIKALLICDSKMAKSYLQDLDDGIVDFIENSAQQAYRKSSRVLGLPRLLPESFSKRRVFVKSKGA